MLETSGTSTEVHRPDENHSNWLTGCCRWYKTRLLAIGSFARVSCWPCVVFINPLILVESIIFSFSQDHGFFPPPPHLPVNRSIVCSRSSCPTRGTASIYFHATSLTCICFVDHVARAFFVLFFVAPQQVAFADLQDDMDLAEDYLKYLVAYALAHCQVTKLGKPENYKKRRKM